MLNLMILPIRITGSTRRRTRLLTVLSDTRKCRAMPRRSVQPLASRGSSICSWLVAFTGDHASTGKSLRTPPTRQPSSYVPETVTARPSAHETRASGNGYVRESGMEFPGGIVGVAEKPSSKNKSCLRFQRTRIQSGASNTSDVSSCCGRTRRLLFGISPSERASAIRRRFFCSRFSAFRRMLSFRAASSGGVKRSQYRKLRWFSEALSPPST